MNSSDIAGPLLAHLPVELVDLVVERTNYCEANHLPAASVITLAEQIPFETNKFITAVRDVLRTRSSVVIQSLNELEYEIEMRDGAKLWITRDSFESRMDNFLALSEKAEERTAAMEKLLGELGPLSDCYQLDLQRIELEPISDEDFAKILMDQSTGVNAKILKARKSLKRGSSTVEDLVPADLSYYERVFGPIPTNLSLEPYIDTVLVPFRIRLIERNLTEGLRWSLRTAIRDDLIPTFWLSEIDDDILWETIVEIGSPADPFSRIALIDLCTARSADDRFQELGERLLNEFVDAALESESDAARIRFVSAMSQLVENRISTVEGGALLPPFWRRMCALGQACLVADLVKELDVNLDRFEQWCMEQLTLSGEYAKLLGFRSEPMYSSSDRGSDTLFAETIGRLLLIRNRRTEEGLNFPDSRIDSLLIRFGDLQGISTYYLPGPLESEQPAGQKNKAKLAAVIAELSRNASELKDFAVLVHLAHFCTFDEEWRRMISESLARTSIVNDSENRLQVLHAVAVIAMINRDTQLGSEVLAQLRQMASNDMLEPTLVGLAMQVALMALASFGHNSGFSERLTETLHHFAMQLSPRSCTELGFQIGELVKVLPAPDSEAIFRSLSISLGVGLSQ